MSSALPRTASAPRTEPSRTRRLPFPAGSRADGAPRWELPALAALLAGTLLLYVWDLAREGWANTYYAAAVQAGTESWTAFFYGSLDSANAITVDKPPLSLWVMELSARVCGLSSWSLLVPQAVAGVLTVLVVHRTVRRASGPVAAILAGAAMALTPVAALIFRYDNPDAILTLLLALSAYTLVRGLEDDRMRWVLATGGLVGAAFLAKSLQAFLVLPAFAGVWMVAAPGGLAHRAGRVAAATGAMVLAGGWWVAIVEAVPAGSRPYIGGSGTNSVLELILGYNGLDRLSASGGAGGGPGGGFSGAAGWGRLFNDQMGGQISWLLPLAAAGLAAGLWLRGRAPRTDLRRAHYLLWGGWAVTHAIVFSAMTGIVHAYYTVAMAPAVAALVGMGVEDMWRARGDARLRRVLPAALAATGLWAYALLERTPDFHPWLRWLVVLGALGGAAAMVVEVPAWGRRLALAGAAVAIVAVLAGPAAYAIDTAGSTHAGGNPLAGPATGAAGVGGRMMPAGGPQGGFAPPAGGVPGGFPAPTGGVPGGFAPPAGGVQGGPGEASANATLVAYLEANMGDATWLAAANGANAAAPLQLAAREPVMAIGGFTGQDPSPTLEEFVRMVQEGRVRFYVGGGMRGGPGGGGSSSGIAAWVQHNGTLVDSTLVGGATVYDLAGAATTTTVP